VVVGAVVGARSAEFGKAPVDTQIRLTAAIPKRFSFFFKKGKRL